MFTVEIYIRNRSYKTTRRGYEDKYEAETKHAFTMDSVLTPCCVSSPIPDKPTCNTLIAELLC
jgi:hypothetical protein